MGVCEADIYAPKADFMYTQTAVRISPDPDRYCGYCKNIVPNRYYERLTSRE